MPRGDAPVALNHDLALAILDVKGHGLAAQPLGNKLEKDPFAIEREQIGFEENLQHVLGGVAQRAQQHRRRDFAPTINAAINHVLGIEFKIQPGAAVRDHAGGVQEFAGGVGLAAIMFEENAGRTVQLRNNHAFGAVDDEGSGAGHQRDFSHVHVLFLDVLDNLVIESCLLVVDDQPNLHAQRCRESQTALLTLLDVKNRSAERVTYIFEHGIAGIAFNGEH